MQAPFDHHNNFEKSQERGSCLIVFHWAGQQWSLLMANEQRGGSGNFANDPERASEAGKKGGEHSHGGQQGQQGGSPAKKGQHGGSSGQQGGAGNFANDREKASEAGRKGGQT
jgi:general stress protein YciG